MRSCPRLIERIKSSRGSVIIFTAIAMIMLLTFAALAVDLGYLFVVGNELHNAADAGALAGARFLYDNNGTQVNAGSNALGRDAATANNSQNAPVEVNWTSGNTGDVERGHWSFGSQSFTPNASLAAFNLWESTTAQLDADINFINAVRVRTRREATPALSFFARIFGVNSTVMSREAVAYIGFAGSLQPMEVDQPLAICKQALLDAQGKYTCGVGRMINSSPTGGNPSGSNPGYETGGWTNFDQPDPTSTNPYPTTGCTQPTPGNIPNDGQNVGEIILGAGIGLTNGELTPVFNRLLRDWHAAVGAVPSQPWKATLIVVDCEGYSVSNCSRVVGGVELNIVWISENDKQNFREVPRAMWNPGRTGTNPVAAHPWTCSMPSTDTSKAAGQQCWREFVADFNLHDVVGDPTDPLEYYQNSTVYFLPDCTPHVPAGRSGGQNFGILAKIPVLVK